MATLKKPNNLILELALLALLLLFGYLMLQNYQANLQSSQQYDCGGFVGASCPSGYYCKYASKGADAGTCVRNFFGL